MAQVEKGLEAEVKEVEYALEGDLKSFGKGFTVIEQARAQPLDLDPKARPPCAWHATQPLPLWPDLQRPQHSVLPL